MKDFKGFAFLMCCLFLLVGLSGGVVSTGCGLTDGPAAEDDDGRRAYDGGPLPDYDGGQCLWASDVAQGAEVTASSTCCELGTSVEKPNTCLMCSCSRNVAGTPVWRCSQEMDVCEPYPGPDGGQRDAGGDGGS